MPGKAWKGDADRLVHENGELKEQVKELKSENAALKLKIAELSIENKPSHISLSSEEEDSLPLVGPQPGPLPLASQEDPLQLPPATVIGPVYIPPQAQTAPLIPPPSQVLGASPLRVSVAGFLGASPTFEGKKKGFVFTTGEMGTGYYRDAKRKR